MALKDKPDYQPWNEEEFQADVFVRGMTWVQKHFYRALLQAAFFHGTRPYLPNDDEVLWVLAGAESQEQWVENKAKVLKRFTVAEHDDNLLENKRVTKDWEYLMEIREQASETGREGGIRSAEARRKKYGSAQPGGVLVGLPNAPSNPPSEESSKARSATEASEVKLSEVKGSEVKERNPVTETAGVSCDQGSTANTWKRIAILHHRLLRKHISAGKETKNRFHEACDKYGADVVFTAFETWADSGTRAWVEREGVGDPMRAFYKKLPDMAETITMVVDAEQQERADAAERDEQARVDRERGDAAQQASIARQTKELTRILNEHPSQNEESVADFFAEDTNVVGIQPGIDGTNRVGTDVRPDPGGG